MFRNYVRLKKHLLPKKKNALAASVKPLQVEEGVGLSKGRSLFVSGNGIVVVNRGEGRWEIQNGKSSLVFERNKEKNQGFCQKK